MSKIEKLQAFLQEDPEDCFLLHALGLEYVKIGDLNTALSYFQKVLSVDEKYVGTYYHLGKTYESLNDLELAMDTYLQGATIADELEDSHALSELNTAIWELED